MASSGQPSDSGPSSQLIVMVVGPGRSGTSTVAGALVRCGLEVPGRAIRGNPTNPAGFYEPRWVVDFHREVLKRHHVGTMDASPGAFEIMAEAAADPEVRDRLRDWVRDRLAEQPRIVVKDPRSIWFLDLWVDVARELGVEPGFVTMLRHPAEVSASRQAYYRGPDQQGGRGDEIGRVAGWVNGVLTAEQVTQGSPRTFVRYADLLTGWRPVLRRIANDLGLEYEPGIDAEPHPVDEFIDESLHRVSKTWADVDVPADLRDLGERVWQRLSATAEAGESAEHVAAVDQLRQEYAQMVEDALALSKSAILRQRVVARRRGLRQGRREEREAAMGATRPSLASRAWARARRKS